MWTQFVLTESMISSPWCSNGPRPSPDSSLPLRDKIWQWPGNEARFIINVVILYQEFNTAINSRLYLPPDNAYKKAGIMNLWFREITATALTSHTLSKHCHLLHQCRICLWSPYTIAIQLHTSYVYVSAKTCFHVYIFFFLNRTLNTLRGTSFRQSLGKQPLI